MPAPPREDATATILAALDVAAGPAVVLDDALRVLGASPQAIELLGGDVPAGVSAPALLCGDRKQRPVAEALAAGKPVRAVIPRIGDETRLLGVRSLPLRAPAAKGKRAQAPIGWLLLLEDAGAVDAKTVLFHGMWTQDPRMREMFRLLERVAADDVTVLVRGESGTGKELVARAIHELSPRGKGPFQAINCAALPPTLLEAELFGTVKGAFTGSIKDTPGLVRSAHKGTLFLDEVAELPLELQAKLLRVLETRMVLPVGGHAAVPVDVRVLSATHRALRKEAAAGRFREDLMYRLRVIPVFIPPLRERRGDVPLLAQKIVEELNTKSRRRIEQIAPGALDVLARHDWPGNVRELRNALMYAFAMGDGPVLRAADLPLEVVHPEAGGLDDERPAAPGGPPDRATLERALAEEHGNRQRAAERLGVSRVTLWRWLKDAGLAPAKRR